MTDEEPPVDWRQLIERANGDPPAIVMLDTHHGQAGSGGSEPQELTGPAGLHHAVKFTNNPQGIAILFNEQVSGRFARLLDAPCPRVDVVQVEPSVAATIRFSNGTIADASPAHGSRWLDDIRPADLGAAMNHAANPPRYTKLMVLFTILMNTDEQYVIETQPPNRLFCVDFGHSLGGSPTWTIDGLRAQADPTSIVERGHGLDAGAVAELGHRLQEISDQDLAECVGGVPAEWNVSIDEQVAVARFLRRRVDDVAQLIVGDSEDAA